MTELEKIVRESLRAQVAVAPPLTAPAARAIGASRRLRRRHAITSICAGVIVLAIAGGGTAVLRDDSLGHNPTPPASLSPPAPTSAPSPTCAESPGPASASTVTVSLASPPPLLPQLPVVETACMVNRGPALNGLSVQVTLGTARHGIGATGFEDTVLEWWNAAGRGWTNVALSQSSSGMMQGSFPFDIPFGLSSVRLRITIGPGFLPQQDGDQASTTIELISGSTVLARQQLMLPVLAPTVAVVSQPTTIQRTGQAEFDFVIQNATGATYPAFFAELNMICQTATIVCNAPGGPMLAGFELYWFEGGVWELLPVGTASNGETFIESGPLPPGSQQIRLRLSFGPDLDPRAQSVMLQLWVGPVNPDSNGIAWADTHRVAVTP